MFRLVFLIRIYLFLRICFCGFVCMILSSPKIPLEIYDGMFIVLMSLRCRQPIKKVA